MSTFGIDEPVEGYPDGLKELRAASESDLWNARAAARRRADWTPGDPEVGMRLILEELRRQRERDENLEAQLLRALPQTDLGAYVGAIRAATPAPVTETSEPTTANAGRLDAGFSRMHAWGCLDPWLADGAGHLYCANCGAQRQML